MKLTPRFVFLTRHAERLKDQSGQSVILIATVIVSFIMFFGFAVNTGLLVAAKISLQTAADAAAYAGAATQARQLNAISFLNYDMRRQYKKFLYRYAVIGSMGNPTFADTDNPSKPGYYDFAKRQFLNGTSQPSYAHVNVPSVCIPLTTNATNDNCLVVSLPNSKMTFSGSGLSQISQILYQQIEQIQLAQEALCKGNSAINLFILINWLFKSEPGSAAMEALFAKLPTTMKQSDRDKALQTSLILTEGLGLMPRNILNLLRIQTLVKFLNEQPVTADQDQVDAWTKATDADQHERTIQAFRSATANLNETVMDHAGLTMTELQAPQQLQTTPVSATFNTYVHYMDPGGAPASNTDSICKASIIPFPISGMPVGVRKSNPNLTVHYAVKLKAKAKLLFLPVKDGLELEAVAGAKPFGSRIGPGNLSELDFVEEIEPGLVNNQIIAECRGIGATSAGCKVPNIKLVGGGAASFYSKPFLNTLKTIIGGTSSVSATTESIREGLKAATAPNPAEVGQYNILPPPRKTKDMMFEFLPYSDDQSPNIYRFYAPLFLAGQNDVTQQLNAFVDQTFGNPPPGGGPFKIDLMQIKEQIKTNMGAYVQQNLNPGTGSENDETMTFAALELPMAGVKPAPTGFAYWLTEANSVLTSWAPTYARTDGGGMGFKPRFGYSVKFVTMQNLLKSGMPQVDDDLPKVNH